MRNQPTTTAMPKIYVIQIDGSHASHPLDITDNRQNNYNASHKHNKQLLLTWTFI